MFLKTGSDTVCRVALASEWEKRPVMADVQRRDGDGSERRTEQADRCQPPTPDVTAAIAEALGERFAAMSPEKRVRLAYHVQRLLSAMDRPEAQRAMQAHRDRNRSVELVIVGMGMAVTALATALSLL
jgi:hypothetical protein